MKVLIIGAGIGGLSAAIALQKKGHKVVIYERVTDLRPIGAAISVWSNGIKVLNAFGLRDEVAKVGGVMDSMSYRKHDDGSVLCDFPLDPLYQEVKQRAFPIARTHLQRMLYEAAGPSNIHLGKKALDYQVTASGVTLELDGGQTDTGDFLVIAEGTHSKLRNKICGKTIDRRYAGYVNFNGAIPSAALNGLIEPTCWTQFVGEGKRVSMMPMGDNQFYFFFDASPPQRTDRVPSDAIQPELREHFQGWHEAVQVAINNLDPTKVARVEIHDTDPLPTLIDPSGRAVLLGDAAHATAPDLGQGGCQAMEDAFVLANLFEKEGISTDSAPTADALQAVVHAYQAARAERVKNLVLRARQRAEITHALNGMQPTEDWYKELQGEDGTRIMSGMIKTIAGAPAELEGQESIHPLTTSKSILSELPEA